MATSVEEIIDGSTTVDSENDSELLCSPCQSDGKRLAAVGYCETCNTSLCELCFKCHTVPIPMRKHRLLKREQQLVENEVIKDNNQCPEHEGECIMYHCHAHSFLGCQTCFFQHQKTCREVKYIPEISQTITSSDEFKEFMTKLNYTTGISKHLVDECKRDITLVEKCHTDALAAMKAFKLELLEAFDQLETELCEEAEMFKQTTISRWNSVVDKHLQVGTELNAISTEIEVLQNKNRENDLYIAMVKSKNKLVSLEAELNAAKGGNVVIPFNFQANTELRESLRSTSGLGKLHMAKDVVKAEHIKDINVKLYGDKYTCNITGSAVISEHKLVIADSNNKNVKTIDTKQQNVLALTLPSEPWSVAKLQHNKVAVSLPTEKKIVFITTEPVLSNDAEIRVNGACFGLAYSEGKLVVGFKSPQKLEIMDVKGSVLRRIQVGDDWRVLFKYPCYVAVNHESSLIYVSDAGNDSVMCLRFDGTIVATYKDNELHYPRQVIVDSTGNLYVFGHSSNNLHLITEDCKKIKVLLTSADGLNNPRTISYEETEGKLYVGQNNTNNIKVYRMI